jgi:hypothetical protein
VTTHATKTNSSVLLLVALISALSFFYNMSHYLLINYTSAHYAVLIGKSINIIPLLILITKIGNMKVIILVLISMAIFDTFLGPLNIVGVIISLGGFCSYNFFRYWESKETKEKESNDTFTKEVVNRLLADKESSSHSSEDEFELKPL